MDPITAAEKRIAAVLAALEIETQSLVDSITIEAIDKTSMADQRQMLLRRVVLTCKPIPGSHWDK